MAQLVGSECVVCHERIRSALDGRFCPECGNPVHASCQESFTSSGSGCPKCGGNPAAAPSQEVPPRQSLAPLGLALGLLVVVALGYVLWPTSGVAGLNEGEAVAQVDANAAGDAAGEGADKDNADKQEEAGDDPAQKEESASDAAEAQAPAREQARKSQSEPSQEKSGMAENPVLEFDTTHGTFKAELFADKAPITAGNFLDLVEKKFYDGITFHRVIKDFMIQGGCPLGTGTGGRTDKGLPAKKLKDEFHPDLRHDKPGILSMANAGPNTGDTQFFVTTVPTPWLDDKHAVFGRVIEGMDVIKKIEGVPTGPMDKPREPVKMKTVRVVEGE